MPAYFVAIRSRIKDPAELRLYAEKSPASAAGRNIKRLATATGRPIAFCRAFRAEGHP